MARGIIGPAVAVVAFGTVQKEFTKVALEEYEADIVSKNGEVKRVDSIFFNSDGQRRTFEVLELLDDDDRKVVLVKSYKGESPTIRRWRDSSDPLGGKKLDPENEVVVVQLDCPQGEHPFIKFVISNCSAKLEAVDEVSTTCVDGGLNRTGNSMHELQLPADCSALKAIIPNPHEAFVAATSRSYVIYNPPTQEQHASTLKTIDGHVRRGTTALIHHQKNSNSPNNQNLWFFKNQAVVTDAKAVIFACDVLRGTIKEEYGVCSAGATVEGAGNLTSLTPMQKMKAALLSDPKNKEAIAYLKPRVGAVHVEKLQACGRALKENENEILALAPAASASKKRRV